MTEEKQNSEPKTTISGKQWLGLISAIPVSVMLSFVLTIGQFQEKITNLEVNQVSLKTEYQRNNLEYWKNISDIKREISLLQQSNPFLSDKILSIENQLKEQNILIQNIRLDLAQIKRSKEFN